MSQNKITRKLLTVGETQKIIEEQTRDKFAATQSTAQNKKSTSNNHSATSTRLSPQISCTVLPEDKQLLNEITVFAINKSGKPLNTSSIIRALIRLGHKRKDELEV
jgi:hypothetical protein